MTKALIPIGYIAYNNDVNCPLCRPDQKGADSMGTTEKKTRRNYGEGSIYQRKDGRWVAKCRDESMFKPRYLYGKTETEVKRKLRGLKRDAARGVAECKKALFSDYVEKWL